MNKHIVKYAPKRELEKPIPATEEWKKAYRLMKVRKRCDFIFIYINSYIHDRLDIIIIDNGDDKVDDEFVSMMMIT